MVGKREDKELTDGATPHDCDLALLRSWHRGYSSSLSFCFSPFSFFVLSNVVKYLSTTNLCSRQRGTGELGLVLFELGLFIRVGGGALFNLRRAAKRSSVQAE